MSPEEIDKGPPDNAPDSEAEGGEDAASPAKKDGLFDRDAIDALLREDVDTQVETGDSDEMPNGKAPSTAPAVSEEDSGVETSEDPLTESPAPDAEPEDASASEEAQVDAPLSNQDLDEPLDNTHPEQVLAQDSVEDESPKEELDSLLAEVTGVEEAPESSEEATEPEAGAKKDEAEEPEEPTAEQVTAENLAAASVQGEEAEHGLLTQDMLDALIADASVEPEAQETAEEDAVEESEAAEAQAETSSEPVEEVGEEEPEAPAPEEGAEEEVPAEPDETEAPKADGLAELMQTPESAAEEPETEAKAPESTVEHSKAEAPPEQAPEETAAQTSEAESTPEAQPAEAAPETVEAPPPQEAPQERPVGALVQANFVRLASSLLFGLLCAMGVFTYLYTHPMQEPDLEALDAADGRLLEDAMRSARQYIRDGRHEAAFDELNDAIETAPRGALRTEAEFLRVEAAFRGLYTPSPPVRPNTVHGLIDAAVEHAPQHARSAEALHWKAKLYEQDGLLPAAEQVYRRILKDFAAAPKVDAAMIDAAELALHQGRPGDVVESMRRLLSQFPGSPYAVKARLILGRAYEDAGRPEDARRLYLQTAQSHPDTAVGAEAYTQLGRMAFEKGDYEDAIRQLETRLETATTLEGNDEVFLLLAKSYRAAGRLSEADRVLRELISFFPETETTSEAFIELCRVLEASGMRREALRVAAQTAQRYPENADALANYARLLVLSGSHEAAGDAFVEAHEAGADDPAMLLAAGRAFYKSDKLAKARDAYEQTAVSFPGTAEAFEAAIEHAKVLHELGETRTALKQLEELATATEGKPQRLPVLTALAEVYEELGLRERVTEVYSQVASATTEPEMLAKAAIGLFEAGAVESGLSVAARAPLASLSDATAYELLMAEGKTLLRMRAERALGKMEQAHASYPGQATAEDEETLLRAYLATGRTARARALVMELDAEVRHSKVDAPKLLHAAVIWGDHLYEKREYRAAEEAYTLALRDVSERNEEAWWALYQRANALLQLGEFEDSLALYDEIAASNNAWANQAKVKAEYARTEQRLRGQAVSVARDTGGPG